MIKMGQEDKEIATQSQPLKINVPEGYIKPMETVTENETVTKDEKRKPKVKTD